MLVAVVSFVGFAQADEPAADPGQQQTEGVQAPGDGTGQADSPADQTGDLTPGNTGEQQGNGSDPEEPAATSVPEEGGANQQPDGADDKPAATPSATKGETPATIGTVDVKWLSGGEIGEDGVLQYNPTNNHYSFGNSAQAPYVARAQYDFTLSGGDTLPAGTAEIRVPGHIFKNHSGGWADNYEVGVPKAPQIGDRGFNYTYDSCTGEIVITNAREITAAGHHMVEISYSVAHPSSVVDMALSQPFKATVKVSQEGLDPVTATSDSIYARIDTKSDLGSYFHKEAEKRIDEWNDAWGPKPADADDYFYIIWGVEGSYDEDNNQPFNIQVKDSSTEGQVVGYSGYWRGTENQWPNYYTDQRFYATCPVLTDLEPAPMYRYFAYGVLVRYPKTLLKDGQVLHNSATETLTERDSGDKHEKTTSATFTIRRPVFNPPGNIYNMWKLPENSSASYAVEGALNALEAGKPTDTDVRNDISYTNRAYVRGAVYTVRDGGSTRNVDDYGYNTYRASLVDDAIFLETDKLHRLDVGDYDIQSINLSDPTFYRITMNELKTGYVVDSDRDFHNYPVIHAYGQFGTNEWVELGYWHYPTSTSKAWVTVLDGCKQRGAYIDLPDGCTGVKVEMDTTEYEVRFGYTIYARVLPSERVLSLIEGQDKVDLVNFNTLYVYDNKGKQVNTPSNTAGQNVNSQQREYSAGLHERDMAMDGADQAHRMGFYQLLRYRDTASTGKSVDTSKSHNDPATSSYLIHYQVNSSTRFYHESDADVAQLIEDGYWAPERSGTFYDLLPRGVVPDLSTVSAMHYTSYSTYRSIPSEYVSVSTVRNWHDTGRTMLVVRIEDDGTTCWYTESPYYYYSGSGFKVEFDAHYPWDNIQDFGTATLNTVAYRSDNESYPGRTDNPGDNNDLTSLIERDLMVNIDDSNDDAHIFGYAQAKHTVSAVTSADTGLSKRVTGGETLEWTTGGVINDEEVSVHAGDEYQYRLNTTADAGTTMRNVMLYDSLENYAPLESDPDHGGASWQGTFVGVDTSVLEGRGVKPVVYYSTQEGLDIGQNWDVADTSVWVPADEFQGDLSSVRAIAVDCSKKADGSDFVLEEYQSAVVFVTMKAPEDVGEANGLAANDAHAFNEVWERAGISSTLGGATEVKLINAAYTRVGLLPTFVTLSVTKEWVDDDDRDGLRTDSVKVRLLADGEPVLDEDDNEMQAELSADNDWSATFEDLPEYNGTQRIVYSLEEVDPIRGYEVSSKETDEYQIVITNTHESEKTKIDVAKVWNDDNDRDGKRPASITVQLLADGEDAGTVELSENNGWKASFDDLPVYRDHGVEIEYSVVEVSVDGYTSVMEGSNSEGYTITNTYEPAKTSVDVSKVWKDDDDKDKLRPDSVTVKLLADGEDTGKTVELSKDNSWKASFDDLPVYRDHGKSIVYTVEEVDVPKDYECTVEGDQDKGFTITNSHGSKPDPTPEKSNPTTPQKKVTKTPVPNTSDNLPWQVFVVTGALAALVVVVSIRMRTRKQ